MRIVGLDIGENTGFSCFDLDDGFNLKAIFVSDIFVKEYNEFYIFNVAKKIENCVKVFNAELVFIEGYAFGGRGFFNVIQSELTAQVKRFFVDNSIGFYEVPLSTMRAALLGNGRAKKSDARHFVKLFLENCEFGVCNFSGHVFDSLLVSIFCFKYLRRELDDSLIEKISNSIIGRR